MLNIVHDYFIERLPYIDRCPFFDVSGLIGNIFKFRLVCILSFLSDLAYLVCLPGLIPGE